jgi:hypothetical protein
MDIRKAFSTHRIFRRINDIAIDTLEAGAPGRKRIFIRRTDCCFSATDFIRRFRAGAINTVETGVSRGRRWIIQPHGHASGVIRRHKSSDFHNPAGFLDFAGTTCPESFQGCL